jgi:RNA polymerase sigma-70 factor (ECF subfamily)
MSASMTMDGAVHPARPVDALAGDAALRALFDRARGGDDRALADLCTHMRPRLYRVALSIVRDPDEADDVAQEALVRAVTRRFLFLGRGSVGGWMTRIAMNLARNRRRDEGRRRVILADAAHGDAEARGAVPAPLRDPASIVDDKERLARLERALADLPARQRDVARLRLIGQLSFEEIAAALQITEANARVHLTHAQRRLTAALEEGLAA